MSFVSCSSINEVQLSQVRSDEQRLITSRAQVARKLRYILEICPLRVRREVANLHVFNHALAKRSHWQLLHRMKRATVHSAMLLQSRLSEGDAVPGPFPLGHDTSLYIRVLK
jgi:hypothetical protein